MNPTLTTRGAEAGRSERIRQIVSEGLNQSHDDKHDRGELASAALAYAEIADMQARRQYLEQTPGPPIEWPWDAEYWKPALNPKRNLEKAMALLMAEWDRLDRLDITSPTSASPEPPEPPEPPARKTEGTFPDPVPVLYDRSGQYPLPSDPTPERLSAPPYCEECGKPNDNPQSIWCLECTKTRF